MAEEILSEENPAAASAENRAMEGLWRAESICKTVVAFAEGIEDQEQQVTIQNSVMAVYGLIEDALSDYDEALRKAQEKGDAE